MLLLSGDHTHTVVLVVVAAAAAVAVVAPGSCNTLYHCHTARQQFHSRRFCTVQAVPDLADAAANGAADARFAASPPRQSRDALRRQGAERSLWWPCSRTAADGLMRHRSPTQAATLNAGRARQRGVATWATADGCGDCCCCCCSYHASGDDCCLRCYLAEPARHRRNCPPWLTSRARCLSRRSE